MMNDDRELYINEIYDYLVNNQQQIAIVAKNRLERQVIIHRQMSVKYL